MPHSLRTALALLLSLPLLAVAFWRGGEPPPPPLPTHTPRWFKGNLHTHSLWSDGDDFPEMIADWYKRHGYHFLALSDHNVLADGDRWLEVTEKSTRPLALKKYRDRFGPAWVETREDKGKPMVRLKPLGEFRSTLEEPGRFLLIPAEEVTHQYAKRPVHLNAINLRDVITPVDGGSVGETITVNHRVVGEQAAKAKRRILTFLNHPNFKWGVTAEDMVPVTELRHFEVYNGHPSVNNEGDKDHASSERVWDILLALRLGKHNLGVVYALATDDAHRYHAFGVGKENPGRGWVMVRAAYLTPEAVVNAIEAADFYASTGVVLDDVKATDGELSLKIRPEPKVLYRTEFIATLKDASLASTPVTDKDGKAATRRYGDAVGKVVAETTSLTPRYRLTGNEWYVRARVVSSKPHPNPYRKGDVESAWTQPVTR